MDYELKNRVWSRDNGVCQKCGRKLFRDPYKTIVEELLALNEIPIFKWSKKCWKCQRKTPIVSYVFSVGYSFNLGDIEKLDEVLMHRYSFVKRVFSKTRGCEVIANTCVHCGSLQGNFFIVEDLIDMGAEPNGENMSELIDIVLPNNLAPEDLGFEKGEPNPFWSRLPSFGHIHHKDGNQENNNLDNLILLCRNCHARA